MDVAEPGRTGRFVLPPRAVVSVIHGHTLVLPWKLSIRMAAADMFPSDNVELARLTQLYAALRQINQAILRIRSRDELFARICGILVDTGGFTLACVGAQDSATAGLVPVVHAGDGVDMLESLRALTDEGRGPCAAAFNRNTPFICNDVLDDPATLPWRDALLRHGFRATGAFPISPGGAPVAVLNVYARDPGCFREQDIALLAEAAADLAFGLEHLTLEQERRQLSESARREHLFADTVVESMPGIVYFFDETGKLLRWNQSSEADTGYTPADAATLHPLDVVLPEDRPRVAEAIARVFRDGAVMIEASVVTKAGRPIPYMLTGRRVVLDGVTYLVGVGLDISERKRAEEQLARSEQKYRELVQLANSIILRWDADGRITFLNEFGQRFFGYTEEELLGRNVVGTIVPHTESGGRDLVTLMEHVLADPAAFEQNVNENMRRNGERVWVAWTNRIVRDAHGEITEILSVGSDITGQRTLEQQFLRAQRLESIGTLAGGIAHDLNNTLTPILMAIEILRAEESDSDRLDMLQTIESSARRGADMIRQVLSFARGVGGERVQVQMTHLVREMAKIADETFLKTIRVALDYDGELWPVLGDPTQLHQVLMNLCVNARDAMADGGTLRLQAANLVLDEHEAARHVDAAPGPYVVITVADTGCGMPQSVLDHIFDPFFTTKESGQGTGLGLPTSRAIVKSHGGFIDVASEVNRGTTFRVFLPAHVNEPESTARTSTTASAPRGDGQLIMVVDDEEAVRRVTRRTLEAFGYRVVVAADAADAIAQFTDLKDHVALVLTDMMMPGLDGPSLIQALRHLSPSLPIIAVSGLLTEGRTIQAASLGVRHFLSKPYDADQLLRELQLALKG